MFYHIESDLEVEKVREARVRRIEINALLHEHYMSHAEHDQHEILQKLTEYCGKSVYNYTAMEVDSYKWDFYNSFYFAYTVVSTIGYGNLAPTNMLGRILMIFYGLIGIPMNGILLAQLGEFFGNVFVRAHKKYKTYKEGHFDSPKRLTPLETRRAGLAAQIFMYLAPGFVMFIFFPAFLFSYYEGWQYDEAVYYAFVTLTTIGFGDYVAGQDNTKGNGILWIIYKIFLIIWISFGLGYLVMIMSFIARGMRSKRITRLEHKLAVNLKQTQSRIWNQFNKDVNYLRRVFNEIYLMKLKPVYRNDYNSEVPLHKFPRSCSFPDLRELIYGGLDVETPVCPRRRANSEVAQVIKYEAVNRVVSETDLQRIDKKATFASHAMVQPAELLARLVNALGYIPPTSDDFEPSTEEEDQPSPKGVEGFSDRDILASEKPWTGSGWRIGDEKVPEPRTRASSEIGLRKDLNNGANHQNMDWTWSGPAASRKIQELIKARKGSGPNKEAKNRSFSAVTVPKNIRPRWFNPFSSKKNSGEMSRRDSSPEDEIQTHLRENYLSHTGNTRAMNEPDRRRSAAPHYFTHTGGNLPNTPDVNLLEETSLADFIRALTALHSRVGAVPDDFINKPQRKMGTASLTPPKLPSLLALFSPPPGFNSQSHSTQSTITGQMARRRFSLRPVDNSGSSTPSYRRKGSFMPEAGPRRFSTKPEESYEHSLPIQQRRGGSITGAGPRRLSLRSEDNSGTSTPSYQRRGSLVPGSRPRRFSLKTVFTPGKSSPHNTPAYTADLVPLHVRERQNPPPYSADPFVFECPKEPLVPAEVVPAKDGISLPVRATPPVPRRFSLRPAQIGVPPAPASPKTPPMGRPVPKWKGGMLQRQISELSLQRRVRAFSLGDVHSIRNERTLNQPLSPLALPNTKSNLSTALASGEEKIGHSNSQLINDSIQTSGSIHQSLAGKSSNDQTEAAHSSEPVKTALQTGNTRPEQGALTDVAVDSTMFVKDEGVAGQAKISETETSNPFGSNVQAGQSAKSSMMYEPLGLHGKTPSEKPGRVLTAIKIDRSKMSVKPLATDSSRSLELESVVIDKPSSTMIRGSYPASKEDSLTEVKVDSPGSEKSNDGEKRGFGTSEWSTDSDVPASRKASVISEKSTGSSGGEKSVEKKISAIYERSVELGSTSGSRKSSTSKSGSDKPRVSIDSYKPLIELKIEKPATNPFEKYKATVVSKLDKSRERKSLDSRSTSTEMKGHRHHSTATAASEVVHLDSTQDLPKHKNSEV